MMRLTPVHYTPYTVSDTFRDIDRLEKAFFGGSATPFATDIMDVGNAYRLEIELPGFAKNEIKISLENKYLTVSAEHAESQKTDGEGEAEAEAAPVRYLCRERRNAAFSRSFNITNIDTDGIEASCENGVLTVILPKKQPIKPEVKEVEIK